MGMFDFFKKDKKQNTLELFNPVAGEVVPIDKVADPVFSQKMMGDGFGVEPDNGEIYSPVDGEIVSIFPTKHAMTLKLANGVGMLIHIGIDTVELDGGPFEVFVTEGDSVSKDTLLAKVDLEALKDANKEATVIIVFTDMDEVEDYTLNNIGNLVLNEKIGEITSK